MTACLWDVFKIPFFLASDTESKKISSIKSKTLHKILLLIHHYLEICCFAYFSKDFINLFCLNFPHKVLLDFERVLEYQHHWKNVAFLSQFFVPLFRKEFHKILWCILQYVYRLYHHQQVFFIVFWNPCFFCLIQQKNCRFFPMSIPVIFAPNSCAFCEVIVNFI